MKLVSSKSRAIITTAVCAALGVAAYAWAQSPAPSRVIEIQPGAQPTEPGLSLPAASAEPLAPEPAPVPGAPRAPGGGFVFTQPAGGGFPGDGRFGGAPPMSPEDEEMQRLTRVEWECAQLAEASLANYTSAKDDAARDAARSELQDRLHRQFKAQQERRNLEVSRIEARLRKLREMIDKRNQNEDAIVRRRLDQLLQEADGLGWNAPGSVGSAVDEVFGGRPGGWGPTGGGLFGGFGPLPADIAAPPIAVGGNTPALPAPAALRPTESRPATP